MRKTFFLSFFLILPSWGRREGNVGGGNRFVLLINVREKSISPSPNLIVDFFSSVAPIPVVNTQIVYSFVLDFGMQVTGDPK